MQFTALSSGNRKQTPFDLANEAGAFLPAFFFIATDSENLKREQAVCVETRIDCSAVGESSGTSVPDPMSSKTKAQPPQSLQIAQAASLAGHEIWGVPRQTRSQIVPAKARHAGTNPEGLRRRDPQGSETEYESIDVDTVRVGEDSPEQSTRKFMKFPAHASPAKQCADSGEQQCHCQSWTNQTPSGPPYGGRTASSRSRKEVRTRKRLATFAHAMSNRKTAEPISARIAGFASATRYCRMGSSRMLKPAPASWENSFALQRILDRLQLAPVPVQLRL